MIPHSNPPETQPPWPQTQAPRSMKQATSTTECKCKPKLERRIPICSTRVDESPECKKAKHTEAKEDTTTRLLSVRPTPAPRAPECKKANPSTDGQEAKPDFSVIMMDGVDLHEGLAVLYRGQGTGFFNSPTASYSSQDSQH